tara:strand:+ start:1550 stop:2023 length:474 start_codon:yes stop_codon:yes gene_type:complete
MSNVIVDNRDMAFIDVHCYVNGTPLGYVAFVVTASQDIRPGTELRWTYHWSRQNIKREPFPVEDVAKKQNAQDEERKQKKKRRVELEPVAVALSVGEPSVGEPSGREVPVAELARALEWADMANDLTSSNGEEDAEVPVQTLVERAGAALAAARSGA